MTWLWGLIAAVAMLWPDPVHILPITCALVTCGCAQLIGRARRPNEVVVVVP